MSVKSTDSYVVNERLQRFHLEHQRELPLILGDKLIARRKKPEDGKHHLAGLLADAFAIAFHQVQAEGESLGILTGGGKGFGQGQLESQILGMGGREGTRGVDAICPRGLCPQHQCSFEPFGFRLEESAPFQRGDPGRGVLELSLRQSDSVRPI